MFPKVIMEFSHFLEYAGQKRELLYWGLEITRMTQLLHYSEAPEAAKAS